MEISIILRLIKDKKNIVIKFILVTITFFLLAFYIYPEKYITEGTLFVYPSISVKQETEVSNEMNFSRNIIGISESPEFKKLASQRVVLNNGFLNFDPSIKIKEITPNLVSLSVYGFSSKESIEKFSLYKASIIEFSNNLKKGSSQFDIVSISNDPVSYKVERNIILYLLIGLISGFFLSVIYLYIKENK